MTEERAPYNTILSPGRELDEIVTEVVGWYEATGQPRRCKDHSKDGFCGLCWGWDMYPAYSTDIKEAMAAWEWLEKNNPWKDSGSWGNDEFLVIGKHTEQPSVMFIEATSPELVNYFEWVKEEYPRGYYKMKNFYFPGETYPHAIALAVVEAGKIKGESG